MGIAQVRLVLAEVAPHAARPRQRAGQAPIDRVVVADVADALGALQKNPVAGQKLLEVTDRRRKYLRAILFDFFRPARRHVLHQPAHTRVARGKARPADFLEQIVDPLTGVEGIEKRGHRAEVQPGRSEREQVILNTGQLRDDRADRLAPRRDLDPEQPP